MTTAGARSVRPEGTYSTPRSVAPSEGNATGWNEASSELRGDVFASGWVIMAVRLGRLYGLPTGHRQSAIVDPRTLQGEDSRRIEVRRISR
jgi:hypothetical protein